MIHTSTSDSVRGAEVLSAGTVSAVVAGMTIGQLNEYLQAGAFIVAMISGLCAAIYYIKKTLEQPK